MNRVDPPCSGSWRISALVTPLLLTACAFAPDRHVPDFVAVIEDVAPAVVGVADSRGVVGSGFRVSGTRLVVTAAHVLSSSRGPVELVSDGRKWPVRVVQVEVGDDLALLELEGDAPLPGLVLADRGQRHRPGEWIIVLGRPFGTRTTATIGIVSAEPGAVLEPKALALRVQVNAAINPGNSGGPVVNRNGRVVGVATATIAGGSGLGFMIPSDSIARIIERSVAR